MCQYWKFTNDSAGEKNNENRLAFGEVTDKSVGTRFWTTVYTVFIHSQSKLSVMYTFYQHCKSVDLVQCVTMVVIIEVLF